MDRFDDLLREAMRREDPGDDFTRRVLARAGEREERARRWRRAFGALFRFPRLAALAACLILVFAGVRFDRGRRARAEGEEAKQQLVLALRIAGTKLHQAQERVLELSQ